MPTSWPPDAVRAQAVAARSYAVRLRANRRYPSYDLCDTTACQVYRRRSTAETGDGNAAVRATAGTILTYRGNVALTQFASSNGGHSAQGDYPYLRRPARPLRRGDPVAGLDPHDQRERHRSGAGPRSAPSGAAGHQCGTEPAPGVAGCTHRRSSAAGHGHRRRAPPSSRASGCARGCSPSPVPARPPHRRAARPLRRREWRDDRRLSRSGTTRPTATAG